VPTVAAIAALGATLFAISPHQASSSQTTARTAAGSVLATVSLAGAITVPRSFLGLSAEYDPVPMWAGRRSALFARVLRLLRPPEGGRLLLRIGGDSADRSFWAPNGAVMPPWSLRLTPTWLRWTRSLVQRTGARLLLDLNLVTGSPAGAACWAQAAERGLPPGAISGFEVGNEPDIYNRRAWLENTLRTRDDGSLVPKLITSGDYDRRFRSYASALARVAPGVPLAGPALAHPSADATWVSNLLRGHEPRLNTVTTHVYPLSACARPSWRRYPTIARVLSPRATSDRARALEPTVAAAHRAGLTYRVGELNSVTCGGLAGVSDSFATALWAPEALFALLRAGVDGANIHVRSDTINAAFALDARHALVARPLLYGLIVFDRTLGPEARLAHVELHGRSRSVRSWAVAIGSGGLNVLLINQGERAAHVELAPPAGAYGTARIERLRAPSLRATGGVTLDGRWLGADGTWRGRDRVATSQPIAGRYAVAVPGQSAAIVELRPTGEGGGHV
jgi:hypothetical protein